MTSDTVGGVWHYALDLIRSLQRHEVAVDLATMGAPLTDDQWEAADKLNNVEVHESEFALEWMADPWDDVLECRSWLSDLVDRTRPDVIHLNAYAIGEADWPAPVLMVGHSCVFSWFNAVRGHPPPAKWGRYHAEVAGGLRRADLVTAPTLAMLAELRRFYGEFRAADPVPNGRSAVDFPPGPAEEFIFSAGRLWDEAKNVAALAEVAPDLEWPVYVAGSDEHPDGGTASFDGVHLLGRLPEAEIARWMGKASVYALPARYEPFGLTILEAALAGCALVLGDIPTLRELWSGSACFVPPEDRSALAGAVQGLMDDPVERTRMMKRARGRALRYAPDQTLRGYAALYGRLMGGRVPSRRKIARSRSSLRSRV